MKKPAPSQHSRAFKPVKTVVNGPLDWRNLVQWLREDGVISADEAARTVTRCASAHSSQHPLQRLAVVGMARESDGHVLTVEALTQWLAQRTTTEASRQVAFGGGHAGAVRSKLFNR